MKPFIGRLAIVSCMAMALLVPLASTAHAQSYGSPACDAALPGSAAMAAIQNAGVPLVCEPRPADAPTWALGYWDSSSGSIRLWMPDDEDPRLVRKTAAHELGHAEAQFHPDWLTLWAQLRCDGCATAGPANYGEGSSRINEDFAEMFSFVNFPEGGVGYSYWEGPLTPDETATMRSFMGGCTPPPPPTTQAPPPPETVPYTPPAATPVAQPSRSAVTVPAAVPVPEPVPVVALPPPASSQRIAAVLMALRELDK